MVPPLSPWFPVPAAVTRGSPLTSNGHSMHVASTVLTMGIPQSLAGHALEGPLLKERRWEGTETEDTFFPGCS